MSNGARYDMMENATGNGSDVRINSGGKFLYTSYAGGGSYGTLTLQMKDPQGNYLALSGGVHSANGVLEVDLAPGVYRVVAATITGVYSYLIKV